jgi:anti-sigma factor RsiW
MKCEEVSHYLSPYLDSELDPKTSFEMSSHFSQCESCHERFEAERRIESAMSVELKRSAARDETYWNRAKDQAFRPKGNGRVWALGLLAVVAASVCVMAIRNHPRGGLAEDLRNEFAAFEAGRWQLEILGSDSGQVETFCRDRLGLAIHVPEKIGNFELEGARRCSLRGATTAFISYRSVSRHIVAFIFSADHLDRYAQTDQVQAPSLDETQDLRVLALRSGWKVICAVGSTSAEELNTAAKAFQEP